MFSNLFDQAMTESASSAPRTRNGSDRVFVLSVGGSVLFEENRLHSERIRAIAQLVMDLHSEGYKFALVVGGGPLARDFAAATRELGANKFMQDEAGIWITRANAWVLAQALPKASFKVQTDYATARSEMAAGRIPVFGGMTPGNTTDGVAVLLAEQLDGVFVNLSNVDGVYSSDPRSNPRAKLYRELSYEKLFEIVSKASKGSAEPGQNAPLDLFAATVLKRSRIPALFLNASNLDNVRAAICGQSFNGTLVQESEGLSEETSEIESGEATSEQGSDAKNPDDYFPF